MVLVIIIIGVSCLLIGIGVTSIIAYIVTSSKKENDVNKCEAKPNPEITSDPNSQSVLKGDSESVNSLADRKVVLTNPLHLKRLKKAAKTKRETIQVHGRCPMPVASYTSVKIGDDRMDQPVSKHPSGNQRRLPSRGKKRSNSESSDSSMNCQQDDFKRSFSPKRFEEERDIENFGDMSYTETSSDGDTGFQIQVNYDEVISDEVKSDKEETTSEMKTLAVEDYPPPKQITAGDVSIVDSDYTLPKLEIGNDSSTALSYQPTESPSSIVLSIASQQHSVDLQHEHESGRPARSGMSGASSAESIRSRPWRGRRRPGYMLSSVVQDSDQLKLVPKLSAGQLGSLVASKMLRNDDAVRHSYY